MKIFSDATPVINRILAARKNIFFTPLLWFVAVEIL